MAKMTVKRAIELAIIALGADGTEEIIEGDWDNPAKLKKAKSDIQEAIKILNTLAN